MAGYSGTPLPKKLGIQPGTVLVLDSAPAAWNGEWPEDHAPLPDAVEIATRLPRRRTADIILSFHTEARVLKRRLATLAAAIRPEGMVWIAWPKRASKVETDMTEDVVRALALPMGLVDVKVCAIDDVWSGLKLVWRVERRT